MEEIGIFKIDKNMCSNCCEDENCPQKYSVNGNCLHIEKGLAIEQVPETWEELMELCKKLEPKLVKENNLYETQITLNINKGGYYAFYPDGTIIFKASNSINYTIAKNRTMSQMFQFIKSIIGEE